jgi:DNA-binding transcriptional LysR family regulator
MLDVRRLRVLLAVHEHGGVAAAARALSFTPPAISQQLAALEREAGQALVDRAAHRATLTPAGILLAEHASAVLARLEQAEADLAGHAEGGPVGVVRVGTIPTIGTAVLPGVLRDLRAVAPGLVLRVEQLEPEQSLPAVARGNLDLAVGGEYALTPRRPDARLHRIDLVDEPVLVALPRGHPAAAAEVVDLAGLAGEAWVAPADPSSCFTMLERACAAAGFAPDVVGHCADFPMALALVSAGQGLAIVPRIAAAPPFAVDVPGVVLRPASPAISRRLFAAVRRGSARHPGIAALLDRLAPAVAPLAVPS